MLAQPRGKRDRIEYLWQAKRNWAKGIALITRKIRGKKKENRQIMQGKRKKISKVKCPLSGQVSERSA